MDNIPPGRDFISFDRRAFLGRFEPPSAAQPTLGRRGVSTERVSEPRAAARSALRDLAKRINTALPNVKDATTQAHLEDSLSEIDAALNPKKK